MTSTSTSRHYTYDVYTYYVYTYYGYTYYGYTYYGYTDCGYRRSCSSPRSVSHCSCCGQAGPHGPNPGHAVQATCSGVDHTCGRAYLLRLEALSCLRTACRALGCRALGCKALGCRALGCRALGCRAVLRPLGPRSAAVALLGGASKEADPTAFGGAGGTFVAKIFRSLASEHS